MKNLIFAALCITATCLSMDNNETYWLQERIEKCKQAEGGWTSDENCSFLIRYITKFYLPLCSGRPDGSYDVTNYTNYNHRKVCRLLNEAMTNQVFVEKMLS